MTVWIVILIVIFSLLVVARTAGSSSGKRHAAGQPRGGGRGGTGARAGSSFGTWSAKPPEALGVPRAHPARRAAERLEAALGADFEARVKDRLMKPGHDLSEDEWAWRWFELKRYFFLCGLLRSVPMYSEKVDDVWHEMLMFTREYEQFCSQFCGGFIHHAPHAPGAKPEQGERAWFDWVYGELFPFTPSTERLWGRFYRIPMPEGRMAEFEQLSRQELLEQRFNTAALAANPDLAAAADHVLARGVELAELARSNAGRPYRRERRDTTDDTLLMTGAMSGVFFASSLGSDQLFDQQMNEAREEEKREGDGGGSYYGCAGGSDDGYGGGNDDNGSGHGGTDGGGSACSSGGSGSDGGSSSSCGGSSCGSGCGSS